MVIIVDIKSKKLLSAHAYIEGKGRSDSKMAVKVVAQVRNEQEDNE